MIDPQLAAFVGVIAILTVTPSATTMLIARTVIVNGQGSGFWVVLGGSLGVFVHALVSALGLSLILVQSAQTFEIVKLFGATYLIFLGIQSIWRAYHRADNSLASNQLLARNTKAKRRSFLEGFLTIVLSPETAVFYLAMLPQFIGYGESVFLKSLWLGSIHAIIRVIWYSMLTIFIGRTLTILNRSHMRQWLEMLSGVALIFFGFKVATAKR